MIHLRTALAIGFAVQYASGQEEAHKYTSPPAYASTVIGRTNVTINYFAPSMHGRAIFGNLVQYDKVWCPGANLATTLITTGRLRLGNVTLDPGSYSLWVIPKPKSWLLIVNLQSGQFHLDYDPAADISITKMKIRVTDQLTETLTIGVTKDNEAAGRLSIRWERIAAFVPLRIMAPK